MKTLFVEAQRKLDTIDIVSIDFNVLPSKIFLAYSIQYKKLAGIVKKRLGKKVIEMQQVLGCTKLNSKVPILLIGSGVFHALNLALQGNAVYILEGKNIKKLEDKEIDKFSKRKKAAMLKFLSAKNIGIIISTKPGQENMEKAIDLKKKIEKQGKKLSIFIADTINTDELENYDIDSWVNTACSALDFDFPFVNLSDIKI